MAEITKSEVLNAFKKIEDKNLNVNLLTLNSIKTVETKINNIVVTVVLTVPPAAVTDELKNKFVDILKLNFGRLEKVKVNIETKVTSHKDEKKERLLPGVKNTIAVASGKGGVGKSTVAVNLAVALARDGAKVGLIDADIYGPSIPLMLGINEKPKIYQNPKSAKMLPLENFGIKLMSIGFLVDDGTPVIWRGPMASGAVKQFMTDVDWEELDYLVFDMPPGTGDIQLTLVQTIPLTGAIIVTTPQEVSLIDARKGLKMFNRVNVPVLGIVENMSCFIAPDTGKQYDIFGSGGGENLAKELEVPFLGGIPINSKIRIGGDQGIPMAFDNPDSDYAKTMQEVARKVATEINLRNLNDNNVEIILGEE